MSVDKPDLVDNWTPALFDEVFPIEPTNHRLNRGLRHLLSNRTGDEVFPIEQLKSAMFCPFGTGFSCHVTLFEKGKNSLPENAFFNRKNQRLGESLEF